MINALKCKTASANPGTITHQWVEMDGTDQIVGRFASRIAVILRGKHKPYFTPHMDCGDYVIVTNAEKVLFSGKKEEKKVYSSYTGYPSGQRTTTQKVMRAVHPLRILEKAVRGMLPKNKLGRQLIKKLKLSQGSKHIYVAQSPKKIA